MNKSFILILPLLLTSCSSELLDSDEHPCRGEIVPLDGQPVGTIQYQGRTWQVQIKELPKQCIYINRLSSQGLVLTFKPNMSNQNLRASVIMALQGIRQTEPSNFPLELEEDIPARPLPVQAERYAQAIQSVCRFWNDGLIFKK